MTEGAYAALAGGYDILNSETDYAAWAEFIDRCFKRFGKIKISEVLDLGCGTGAMTFALRQLGYDMTGVDLSCDMLAQARERALRENAGDILWLCQDMRGFELYGTVQGAVCCLDGINHLTAPGDLDKCLALLHNYIEPGGVFVFDVNSPSKFSEFYDGRDYILEDESLMCCWQNVYDKKRRICTFYITVFEKNADGSWRRTDGEQKERCYSGSQLTKALERAGFTPCGIFGGFDFEAAEEGHHRWYIAALRN